MLKRDELTNPNSCINKARDDEWVFVLLQRDSAAPEAVRAWIEARIAMGKNKPDDPKILEAERWIEAVECPCGTCEHRLADDARDRRTLAADLAAAREREGVLEGLLRKVEWRGGVEPDCDGVYSRSCPHCGFFESSGHSSDCGLAAALAPAEREGPNPPETPDGSEEAAELESNQNALSRSGEIIQGGKSEMANDPHLPIKLYGKPVAECSDEQVGRGIEAAKLELRSHMGKSPLFRPSQNVMDRITVLLDGLVALGREMGRREAQS